MPTAPAHSDSGSAAAAPAWQSIATVLLIVHFFCVAVALAVNVGGGKSLLGRQLRLVPLARKYLQLLLMDYGYDSPLAGAGSDEGIHRLRLLEADAPRDGSSRVIAELPTEGIEPRIRRQRYHYLAWHVAFFDDMFEENLDLRTLVPLAIAERWTKFEGLPTGAYTLQCLRIPSPRLPKAIEADISYAYVMREGGLQQQAVEAPPPEPVNIFLVWDPVEQRYQGSREAPLGQRTQVVRPVAAPPLSE